jgi:phage/plasmid-like protein (TIGR03299 family)
MGHLWKEGFVVREAAWHGLAEVLPDYPGLEEGMKLAGHDHQIVERRLFVAPGPEQQMVPLVGWKALAREDSGDVVSVMESSYTVIQNRVPWELLDSLFAQGARWDTAGILKGRYDENSKEVKGSVYWCMALLDEPETVKGDNSPILPYIAATWSHDGSQAVRFRAMATRIVCANTHHAAMYGAEGRDLDVSIRHIGDPTVRIEKAREALQIARKQHAAFLVAANELAGMPVSDEGIEAFVETVVPMPLAAAGMVLTDRVVNNVRKARGELRAIFDSPTIAPGIRNTAYGLFEAGVEYFDHIRPYRTAESYFTRNVMRPSNQKLALDRTVRELAKAYAG